MSNVTRKLAGATTRLLLAYLLIFAQGAWAAQDTKPADTAKPAQKTAVEQTREKLPSVAAAAKARTEEGQGEASENAASTEKLPGDGKHEGIKVHGHWTIDVKNPDGTLVTHREFENSIQASGSASLASLLKTGNQMMGVWQVNLIGNPQPCVEVDPNNNIPDFGSGPQPCVIVPGDTTVDSVVVQPGTTQTGAISFTLTVNASSGQLVLTGSATAQTTTSVSSVATVLSPCYSPQLVTAGNPTATPPTPATYVCRGLPFPIPAPFTAASLTPGVPVSAGQTIAVTVTISFS